MPSYQPGIFQIIEAQDVERIRLRIGDVSTGIGAILGSVIGDPNGRERGWPGDVRFQIDNPSLWQKLFGEGDEFGWVELEASGFAAAITALQLQVAQLTADLAALAAQVGANTAAIAALTAQVNALTILVGGFAAAIAALQAQTNASFMTINAEPTLPNHRRIVLAPTSGLDRIDNPGAQTFDLFIAANGVTDAMAADMPANTIKANPTNAAGDPQNLAVPAGTVVGRSAVGDLVAAQVTSSQVGNNQITNVQAADMAANTIKANPTGVLADPQDFAVPLSSVVGRGPAGDLVAAQLVTSQVGNNQIDNTKAADMAANTIKANPTGAAADPQDLAVAASTVVGRGPAGDIVAAQLVTSQVANNQIDNTKAADMPARTAKANTTNALADPQDVALASLLAEESIYYAVSYAGQPSQALGDGAHVIDGLTYQVVQSALAGSLALTLGSGIVWTAPAAARSWAFSSLTTAPYMYLDLAQIPNIDFNYPIIIDIILANQLYPNGNDAVRFGLWTLAGVPYAASTQRGRFADVGNFGATSTLRIFDGTTPVTSPEAFTHDVVSLRVEPIAGFAGTSFGVAGATFPQMTPSIQLQSAMGNVNPAFNPATRLAFIWINSSATAHANIIGMRVRRG